METKISNWHDTCDPYITWDVTTPSIAEPTGTLEQGICEAVATGYSVSYKPFLALPWTKDSELTINIRPCTLHSNMRNTLYTFLTYGCVVTGVLIF
jgi:hypothetical protein